MIKYLIVDTIQIVNNEHFESFDLCLHYRISWKTSEDPNSFTKY